MTTFTWPARRWMPQTQSFRLRPLVQSSISAFTGAIKSSSMGMLWTCECTWAPMANAEAYEFQAFLEGLEGPVNPVWMTDWRRPSPRAMGVQNVPWSDGTYFSDGTGWADEGWSLTVAAAASAGARSVTLTGFPASTDVLYPGEVIGIGNSLLSVATGVTSDSAGVAMVSVLPGLRSGVAIGDPVTTYRPRVLMRLSPDSMPIIDRQIVNSGAFSLTFIETLESVS